VSPSANVSLLDRKLAYAIFRLTLGINILIHGAVRIFGHGTGAFAAKMGSEFADTPMPQGVAHVFLVVLPFAESILGLFISLGLLTRWALALGGLLMTALVFGTALRSDFSTLGIQMIYAITYYLLLANCADDYFSVDALLRRHRNP
jgi:thiosulfate dehydrogenase (quinone) large subunit